MYENNDVKCFLRLQLLLEQGSLDLTQGPTLDSVFVEDINAYKTKQKHILLFDLAKLCLFGELCGIYNIKANCHVLEMGKGGVKPNLLFK